MFKEKLSRVLASQPGERYLMFFNYTIRILNLMTTSKFKNYRIKKAKLEYLSLLCSFTAKVITHTSSPFSFILFYCILFSVSTFLFCKKSQCKYITQKID